MGGEEGKRRERRGRKSGRKGERGRKGKRGRREGEKGRSWGVRGEEGERREKGKEGERRGWEKKIMEQKNYNRLCSAPCHRLFPLLQTLGRISASPCRSEFVSSSCLATDKGREGPT
jgi:hypothetical protein